MSLLRLITPWRVAGRLFGSYRPKKLIVLDAANFGRAGIPAELSSPLLEKLFSVRWLFSLGALTLLAQLATNGVGDFLQQLITVCSVTMFIGAPSVLLIVLGLYLVADPSHRRGLLQQLRSTIVVAALAWFLVLFAIGNYIPLWPDWFSFQGLIDAMSLRDADPSVSRVLLSLFVLLPLFLWFCAFGLCSAYLVHNNSFNVEGGVAGGTVTDPVINIWLAWSVAGFNLVGMSIAGVPYGTSTVVFAVLGAAIATAISAWELRLLLAGGASFRHGPWGRTPNAVG